MSSVFKPAPPSQPQLAESKEDVRPDLLESVIERTPLEPARADGIAIGRLTALENGLARVDIPAFGLSGLSAQTVAPLDETMVGESLALGFEANNPRRPIVLGRLLTPGAATAPEREIDAVVDGERVTITGEHEIELRCGEAAIVLSADGRIQLRGTYITSHASATQRILGGSVNVN